MQSEFLRRYWITITVYGFLIVLIIAASLTSKVFLTKNNITNILCAAVPVGLLCIGQNFTVLAGGIDLSVGSTISLAMCLTAGIINGQESLLVPVITGVIVLSLFIGFCNGFIATKTGVSPIIVTLGMMAAIQGITLVYAKAPIGSVPSSFMSIAWGKVWFIPVPVLILGIVAAVGVITLKWTTFGRYVYATGGNNEIARLSGIKTERIKIVTYMICSLCAVLASLVLVSRMGMGDPMLGETFMFESLVPVLLGGTAFSGGKGGIVGTLGGVLILAVLNNGLNLFDVSPYWQMIAAGVIMLSAVCVYGRSKG